MPSVFVQFPMDVVNGVSVSRWYSERIEWRAAIDVEDFVEGFSARLGLREYQRWCLRLGLMAQLAVVEEVEEVPGVEVEVLESRAGVFDLAEAAGEAEAALPKKKKKRAASPPDTASPKKKRKKRPLTKRPFSPKLKAHIPPPTIYQNIGSGHRMCPACHTPSNNAVGVHCPKCHRRFYKKGSYIKMKNKRFCATCKTPCHPYDIEIHDGCPTCGDKKLATVVLSSNEPAILIEDASVFDSPFFDPKTGRLMPSRIEVARLRNDLRIALLNEEGTMNDYLRGLREDHLRQPTQRAAAARPAQPAQPEIT